MTIDLRSRTNRPLPPSAHPAHGWGWGRWLWRTLTSMRTAVVLLGLLAAAAIPGSLLPQRNVASDPAAVIDFAAQNPVIYPWLDRVGMFEVYASSWFAAIYLLLLISMTGCVLPRCARLWRSIRASPAPAPRNLARLEGHQVVEVDAEQHAPTGKFADVLAVAALHLRRRGFRVAVGEHEVSAEKGYLREAGNLLFHLSLLVLLLGVALGDFSASRVG